MKKAKTKNFELTIKAVNGSADNGFSGMLLVKDTTGKIVNRKGFWGWTEAAVETLVKEYLNNN